MEAPSGVSADALVVAPAVIQGDIERAAAEYGDGEPRVHEDRAVAGVILDPALQPGLPRVGEHEVGALLQHGAGLAAQRADLLGDEGSDGQEERPGEHVAEAAAFAQGAETGSREHAEAEPGEGQELVLGVPGKVEDEEEKRAHRDRHPEHQPWRARFERPGPARAERGCAPGGPEPGPDSARPAGPGRLPPGRGRGRPARWPGLRQLRGRTWSARQGAPAARAVQPTPPRLRPGAPRRGGRAGRLPGLPGTARRGSTRGVTPRVRPGPRVRGAPGRSTGCRPGWSGRS
jgi:hypothetical protein